MDLEAVAVMVVGLAALATLRLILAVLGREFDADHSPADAPPADDRPDVAPRPTVHRGTGRQRHLLYFTPAEARPTAPAAVPEEPTATQVRRAS